jgi:hypothetical protein
MTAENIAAFSQPKPTIAELLIEGFTTDQTGVAILKRIGEHYPTVTQAEFEAAEVAARTRAARIALLGERGKDAPKV